jgi:pimeloyl-ACP methyl ester carboxylesterase
MPTAAGTHYFLHEGGSSLKAPLVLVHGAGVDHLFWPPEIRRLPENRVFAIDLPGHGKTEGLGRQHIDEYASSLIRFMDGAGLARAVVGGHGMGGAIALSLALNHPERVAGLILIASGARLPMPALVMENGAHPSSVQKAIDALTQISFLISSPADLREAYCQRLGRTRQTLLFGDWLACDQFDVTGRINQVKKPTLVICGKADRLTPAYFSEMLASGIHGAAMQTVDDGGHMLVLERPNHIANLIRIFMGTVQFQPGQ